MRGNGQHIAVFVDILAKRYGWTWDYIVSLPMRKIDSLLKVIEEEGKNQKREQNRAQRKAEQARRKQ